MKENLSGGCFCGDVRYEVSGAPALQVMCFCRDCLSITGTDGYAGYMVKEEDFHLKSGTPNIHEKISIEGRKVIRSFCGTCGSNLWGQTEFGLISIAAGTLDDPEVFQPTMKVFTDHAPHWARIPHALKDA